MTMIEHILIPTDGSRAANAGVEQGVALAALLGAKVTFLAVIEPLSAVNLWADSLDPKLTTHASRRGSQAIAWLEHAQSVADHAGVRQAGWQTSNRRVDQAICAAASQHGCDLIVIGSARTPTKGLFVPFSCARRVAGEAPVPVLIVH
jgi:nucleotide-binding universal stress UspA family protein